MRRALCTLLVVAPLVWPARARAQEGSAIAEQLFRNGRALIESGKVAEGCEQLASSERLAPAIGTRLNIALCRELEGKLATAWSLFADVEAEATRAGDAARATLAHEHGVSLAGRLAKLVIRVASPPPNLSITLDGIVLPSSVVGTELPVDPGEHALTLRAAGKRTWSEPHLKVPASPGVVPLDVALVDDASAAAAPLPVAPATIAEPSPPAPADTTNVRAIVGYTTAGVGLALVGLAAYYGVTALDRKGDEGNYPQGSPDRLVVYDQAKDAQTGELVAGAIGLVALGTGVFLVVSSRRSHPASHEVATALVPTFGARGGSLSLRGSF